MKKLLGIIIFIVVICSCGANQKEVDLNEQSKGSSACDTLVSLENCFGEKNKSLDCLGNINSYVSFLEKKTRIESQAIKDIDGYHYSKDSLFYEDLAKWREKMKCSDH